MKTILVIALMMIVGMGCSSVQVKPLTAGSNEEGLRFYQPEPYLLVSVTEVEGKTTSLKSEIVWLPNFKRGYIVKPTGYIGSSEVKATLANGWNLTDFGLIRDSKVAETISAVAGAVSAIAALDKDEDLKPGLYQFIYDDEGYVKSLKKLKTE